MRERVALARCETYRAEELEPLIHGMFETLGIYDELKPGMTAVLKPNLVMRAKPEEAVATHPAFVAAVGKCVKRPGQGCSLPKAPAGPMPPG